MNGKGDKRRPSKVSEDQFDENWERIFGGKLSYEPLPDIDWSQGYDFGAPSRDGSHLTDEERKIIRENMPTDLWAFPPKDKMLREVNYDNMWQHSCTVEMGVMWIGKDETCNYCGAWEEDEQ